MKIEARVSGLFINILNSYLWWTACLKRAYITLDIAVLRRGEKFPLRHTVMSSQPLIFQVARQEHGGQISHSLMRKVNTRSPGHEERVSKEVGNLLEVGNRSQGRKSIHTVQCCTKALKMSAEFNN